MEQSIRRVSFGKDDRHLFQTIRRKVSSRESRGYMIQTFREFTNGYLYYEGCKLVGITIWENVEGWPNMAANNPGKQPDYMKLCIYHNPNNLDCILTDVEEQCRLHKLEYITYKLFENDKYPLFLKHNYYMIHGFMDLFIFVEKYIDVNLQTQKKIHIINNMYKRYINSTSNIYRQLVESFHAEALDGTKISFDQGNQENTF